MEDYVAWQRRSMRRQVTHIDGLTDSLKSGNLSQSQQVAVAGEVELLENDLKAFLEGSFQSVEGKLIPKYTKLEHLVNKEMTCALIKEDSKLCHYRCCLGRCNKCKGLPDRPGETYSEVPVDMDKHSHHMINWRYHEIRNECSLHGAFVNTEKGKSTECPKCSLLPEEERPTKKPRRSEDLVKKRSPIKEFKTFMEDFINKKWRLHRWQVIGINYHCKKIRNFQELFKEPKHQQDVAIIRDYTDRVTCSYDKSTQSGELGGGQRNIGMEGILCCFYNPDTEEVEHHWCGCPSDEKQQDARTSFFNARRFIRHVKTLGYLTKLGSTLWVQSDGCSKQCKSGTVCWTYSHLSKTYSINIDCFVTTAGHGKCLVDSLAGTDKAHLAKGFIKGIDPARVDENNKSISEAQKACDYLNRDDRPFHDTKHKPTKGAITIKTRTCEVSNCDQAAPMPLESCSWKQWASRKETRMESLRCSTLDVITGSHLSSKKSPLCL